MAPRASASSSASRRSTCCPARRRCTPSCRSCRPPRSSSSRTPRYLAAGSRLAGGDAEAFNDVRHPHRCRCYHSTEAATVALDRKGQAPDNGRQADRRRRGAHRRRQAGGRRQGRPDLGHEQDAVAQVDRPSATTARRAPASGMVPIGGIDKRAAGCAPATSASSTRTAASASPAARTTWSRSTASASRSARSRAASRRSRRCKAAQAHGRHRSDGGPMVVARVVVTGKCGAEEIIDHCARNLAPYKVPRRIEFCDDAAAAEPRGSAGHDDAGVSATRR